MEGFRKRLWESDAPGHQEGFEVPYINYYPAPERKTKACVVTFAGGGYRTRAAYECTGYRELLHAQGIDVFDVDYRVKPTKFPYPLLDARRAVRYIRAHAEELGLDPNRIAVMGSSAGGHLAALISTYRGKIDGEGVDELDEVDYIPNAQILCYPVLDFDGHSGSFLNLLGDEKDRYPSISPAQIVDKTAPPAFIWHTETDNCVDVNNTFRYATALHNIGVSFEMHIYPLGGHGLGVGYHPERNIDVPYIRSWTGNLLAWLKLKGWIEE
jgi:acetyl esterase/lipase